MLFHVWSAAGDTSYKTRMVTATAQLPLSMSVNKCLNKLGQRARSIHETSSQCWQDSWSMWRHLHGDYTKMSSTNNHYLPLQYHLGMTVYVSELIKQPELFFYNKHWLGFTVVAVSFRVEDMGGWLQQCLEEETLWFGAPPPPSIQKNWINDS